MAQVTGRLSAVERGLLATRMAALRATLDPAVTIQNWHSLGILDFVTTINKVCIVLTHSRHGWHCTHHGHVMLDMNSPSKPLIQQVHWRQCDTDIDILGLLLSTGCWVYG